MLKILINIFVNCLALTDAIPRKMPIDLVLGALAETGCVEDGGYKWCPSLEKCVRPWEVYCQEFDFPYNALYEGSGIIMPTKSSPGLVQDSHSVPHTYDSVPPLDEGVSPTPQPEVLRHIQDSVPPHQSPH